MQHHPSLLQCCIENVSNGNITTNDWEFYSSTFTGQQRMVNYSLSVIIVLYAITCFFKHLYWSAKDGKLLSVITLLYAITCFIQASDSLLVSRGWQTAQCYHSTLCHNLFHSSIFYWSAEDGELFPQGYHSTVITFALQNVPPCRSMHSSVLHVRAT